MTCTTCGAELPADAKYCLQCGTAVQVEEDLAPTEVISADQAEADVEVEEEAEHAEEPAPIDGAPAVAPEDIDVPLVDPADPVDAPPTEALLTHPPRSLAMPHDETATGVTSPALNAVVPTPKRPKRQRRPLEERGTFEEFVDAILPIVRAPRFTGNLLAALIALAASMLAAVLVWAVMGDTFDDVLVIPGTVDTGDASFGLFALVTAMLHQVPLIRDDQMWNTAPLLLALLPLLGCALGVVVARRVMPCSGKAEGFGFRVLPFALCYALLLFIWSMFGEDGWHAAHVRSFLAGLVFAAAGAWLAERWLARRGEQAAAPGVEGADAATPAPAPPAPQPTDRLHGAIRTAARVLVLALAIGAIGWLVGSLTATFEEEGEGRGSAVVSNIVHSVEGGFKALGFGVLAEGDPDAGIREDEGTRVFDLGERVPDAAAVIFLVVSLAIVVIGGLFSGFAIARRVQPRSRNDHALYGAITGPVWAGAMLLAHFVVLSRWTLDDDTWTSFDAVQVVMHPLVFGALFGALGGLLASHSHAAPDAVERAADEVAA